MKLPSPRNTLVLAACLLVGLLGCRDNNEDVQRIRQRAQQRIQQASRPDHLQKVFELLAEFVSLNEREAAGQVAYHLNEWLAARPDPVASASEVPQIALTLDLLDRETLQTMIAGDRFLPSDAGFLRDSYVCEKLVGWLDTDVRDDPLLADWMSEKRGELPSEAFSQLQTASRIFDWVIRNVSLEPEYVSDPQASPSYPFGMTFGGPGYRQTDWQTLWRGGGDRMQRAGIFTRLCQHAGVPAAVLAIRTGNADGSTPLQPWAVGVLIQGEIYLYEPLLGMPIPGPDQRGIATLAQARKDASVMRRLDVAGFYNYPLGKDDVQQNIALLNVRPEQMTERMRTLQNGLIGDDRMTVHLDVAAMGTAMDESPGIAGARLWNMPLLAEVYQARTAAIANQDPRFAQMVSTQWHMILENRSGSGQNLSLARWKHLCGDFEDPEAGGKFGARTLYLKQRAPEFEIDDLRTNLELQKAYGLRRELGDANETFESQILQIQDLMRLSKRTSTYWLSLLQYDDGRLDTAVNWLGQRVLDDRQQSFWRPAASYNYARTLESTGQVARAIDVLKSTENAPQAHGNRLRSRLLGDQDEQASEVAGAEAAPAEAS